MNANLNLNTEFGQNVVRTLFTSTAPAPSPFGIIKEVVADNCAPENRITEIFAARAANAVHEYNTPDTVTPPRVHNHGNITDSTAVTAMAAHTDRIIRTFSGRYETTDGNQLDLDKVRFWAGAALHADPLAPRALRKVTEVQVNVRTGEVGLFAPASMHFTEAEFDEITGYYTAFAEYINHIQQQLTVAYEYMTA